MRGDQDLVCRKTQDKGCENCPIQSKNPGQGIQEGDQAGQEGDIPRPHICQSPDEESGRSRYGESPAKYKEGSVEHGAKDHLTDFRPPGRGGSSRVKEEGMPLRSVLDRRKEAKRAAPVQNKRVPARTEGGQKGGGRASAPACGEQGDQCQEGGNFPLQGIRQEVRTAISFSLGESIMRQPVTPTALQPRLMHMVRACFPQVRHF